MENITVSLNGSLHRPSISRLKTPAEKYEQESCFNDFQCSLESLMHETERKFIHGLVRYLRPKRILEIGVWYGGGSAVLLNAIGDFKDSKLVSIDLSKEAVWPPGSVPKKTGWFAKEKFFKNKNWKLITGKDTSEVIEKLVEIDGIFDFCIIDTGHIHPIESLNFLTVLPFLSDNAVIIIHDLALFSVSSKHYPIKVSHDTEMACKLLFDCLCGEKLKIKDKKYLENCAGEGTFSNIGAIQITKDTKKHIQNVFSMLSFPWGIQPSFKHLNLIAKIIKKYYSTENFMEFCKAVSLNLKFIANGYSYTKLTLIKLFEQSSNIIYYGAGGNCWKLLAMVETAGGKNPSEIWDINSNITDVQGIKVKQPDFAFREKYKNCIIVITIGNEKIAKEVKAKLKKCGFFKIYFYKFYNDILPHSCYSLLKSINCKNLLVK
jgi:predicted O-methyltransferase YrrM